MQQTYYSLDTLPAIGPVNESDRRTRAGLVELYRAAPPGVGYDDHWTQSQKFKEMVYVALRATMDAMAGSTVSVVCERKKRRAKTTFGKSFVAKSLAHSQDRDESFTPIDPEHPLARIVQCPNPHEKFSDIIEYVVMQNGLTGDAPVWGIPSAKFLSSGEWRPVELYALPRVLCQPQTAANIDYPRGYWRLMPYFPGGSGFWFGSMGSTGGILDAREVYRFKDKHPYITWAGWGKLAACGMMLDVLEGIDQSRWSAMQNGVTPDMVVTGSGFDAQQITEFDTELKRKNAGSRNSRKVLYLFSPVATPDTKAQVQWPSLGAREMDYTGSWEQATAAVLAAFRVPKGPAGLAVASSYGQLYAENKQWHTYGLQPLARRLAQFFSMMLAEPWCEWPGQYRVQIDVPELNDKDMEEKQKARWASTGTADYNEIRAADQLPPKPGGDVPVQVYVAQQQQKFAPDPMQALGMPGQEIGELGDKPENKVSAPGGPPQPENKDGNGSLPPRIGGKAMSSLEGSTGGFLVKPPQMGRKAKRKLRRFTRRLCKGFDESKHPRDHGKFAEKKGADADEHNGSEDSVEGVLGVPDNVPRGGGSRGGGSESVRGTKSPAFKKWFGDSKVVDESGEPLVVYHGAGADFDSFEGGDRTQTGGEETIAGIYMTASKGNAEDYAKRAASKSKSEPRIIQAYVRMEAPYEMTVRKPEDYKEMVDSINQARIDKLANDGYDGIVINFDMPGPFGLKERMHEVIAFEPTQIKSVENSGTFDPNDPRIHKSQFDESKVKRDKGKFSSKPGAGAEQGEPDAHDTPRSDDTGSYHPGPDSASTIPGDYSPEEASHQLETLAGQAADIPDFDPKAVLTAWGQAARGIGREAMEGIGHHLQLLAEHGGRPDHVDAAVQSMGAFIGKVAKVGGRLAIAVFKALRAFSESASKSLGPFGWWLGSIVAGAAIVAAPVLAVQFGLIPLAAGLAAAPAAAMAGAVGARVVGGDMAGRSARKNWE